MTVAERDVHLSGLLARIDQLTYDRNRFREESRRLRQAVERKDLRIAAMRGEQRVMSRRLYLYEKDIARLENELAARKASAA